MVVAEFGAEVATEFGVVFVSKFGAAAEFVSEFGAEAEFVSEFGAAVATAFVNWLVTVPSNFEPHQSFLLPYCSLRLAY